MVLELPAAIRSHRRRDLLERQDIDLAKWASATQSVSSENSLLKHSTEVDESEYIMIAV